MIKRYIGSIYMNFTLRGIYYAIGISYKRSNIVSPYFLVTRLGKGLGFNILCLHGCIVEL